MVSKVSAMPGLVDTYFCIYPEEKALDKILAGITKIYRWVLRIITSQRGLNSAPKTANTVAIIKPDTI